MNAIATPYQSWAAAHCDDDPDDFSDLTTAELEREIVLMRERGSKDWMIRLRSDELQRRYDEGEA